MKRLLTVCVVAAIVLAASRPVSADRPPKGAHYNVNFVTKLSYTDHLFYDDFTYGYDPCAWDHVSGWTEIVDDGGDYGLVLSIEGGSYVGEVVATTGSESWTDYTLEFDVKKASGNYFNVVFRYTDLGNHYLLEPSADEIHIALFKKVGGGGYQELTALRPLQDTFPGIWYHYKIVVQGPSIKIYVDDVLKFDVIDSSLTAGKIGIGGYSGSVAYFDNVEVMGVDPDEILVAFNGTVPGLRYVGGDAFEILDHDAGVYDGDAAVLQMPCDDVFDIYCSARGHPGGVIHWGIDHERHDVPARKPTWHQQPPDNFSLRSLWGDRCSGGPYAVTTSNDATILATRWYPQP